MSDKDCKVIFLPLTLIQLSASDIPPQFHSDGDAASFLSLVTSASESLAIEGTLRSWRYHLGGSRLPSFCRLLGSFIVIFTITLEEAFVIPSARKVGAHSGRQHQTRQEGRWCLQTCCQHLVLKDPRLYCWHPKCRQSGQ